MGNNNYGLWIYEIYVGGGRMESIKKTKYEIETTEDYQKVKRIDEQDNGQITSSTILQNKDEILINP